VCVRGGGKPDGSDGCEESGTKLDEFDRGMNPDDAVGILYRGPRLGGGLYTDPESY
jgi:hypothetical protein